MAGYSATPLPRKLGIKEGHTVAILGAPRGWRVAGLPKDVSVRHEARGRLDVVLAFFGRGADLERRVAGLTRLLRPNGALWVAWPRKAGGHVSDITENRIREIVLPTGLVDTKVAALDDDWSGLRFVWRRALRPGS